MIDFLKYAKIKKKTTASLALFFILAAGISFISLPTVSMAAEETTEQEYLDTSWLDPAPPNTTPSVSVFRWIGNLISYLVDTAENIYASWFSGQSGWSWLFGELISLISQLFKYMADGSAALFRYVLNEFIVDENNRWAITRGGGNAAILLISWNIVKGWANMIIVLLLIAAAAMMILRLWTDRAKKLLTEVIILALLINFSILFIGLIIDVSNVLAKSLVVGAEGEVLIVKQLDKAWNAVARPLRKPIDFSEVARYLAVAGLLDIMYLIAAFVLLAFSLIVIQRYIILAILFILSPLAFAFMIFPHESAKGLWNSWWQNFLKYCFVLAPAVFFLRLSSEILAALDRGNMINPENITQLVFNFIIVIGFLIGGLIITKRSMGPVVNGIMSGSQKIALGTVGLAAGAAASLGLKGAKAGGGIIANATGTIRAYNAVKDWAGDKLTAVGEKTLVLKKGALANRKMAKAEAKGMKEHEKTAENMAKATPEEFEKVLTGTAWTTEAVKLKAAAIRHAAETGKLGKHIKDPKKQAEALKYADNHYGARDEEAWNKATQKNADIAKHDEVKVDEEKKKLVGQKRRIIGEDGKTYDITYSKEDMAQGKTSWNYDEMQKEAKENAVKKDYSKMKVENIENESHETVAEKAKAKTAEGSKYLEEAIKRKILGMVGTFEEVGDLIQRSSDSLGSDAMENAVKIDYRYKEFDEKAVSAEELALIADLDRAKMPHTTKSVRDAAKKRVVANAAKKNVTARSLRESLPIDAIDLPLLENIGAQTLSESDKGDGLSAEKRDKLKELLPEVKKRADSAAADSEEKKKWMKMHEVITILSL